MLSLEEAQARVLSAITPLGTETVPLSEAIGRVTAEDCVATTDLPLFDNSAMDGFAVRANDVRAASATSPIRLSLSGQIAAGDQTTCSVHAGTAVRVFTGSPLPAGADAVVMQEDTRWDDATVEILDSVKRWENVRLRGEDVKRGGNLLRRGEIVDVCKATVLAATGTAQIAASRKPVIALLSTGDELCEPGTQLRPGQIYESNRLMLSELIKQVGAVPKPLPIVRDDPETTRAALQQAFAESDAVVTSGGVSVGERDFVKDAFASIGGTQDFWRVAIRPGKPFVFGRLREKFLFGLPGNPVSAFVTFLLLVRPALLRMQAAADVQLRSCMGILGEPFENNSDRRHFARVNVDSHGVVRSPGPQASHRLGSLARANGLLDLMPGKTLSTGKQVSVSVWQTL